MTIIVSVRVPEGADYKAKVTLWSQECFIGERMESVSTTDAIHFVLPGEEQDFGVHTSNIHNIHLCQTVTVREVPLAAGDRPDTCP
jgi:hypothetical protein